jgi:hypothetical protein
MAELMGENLRGGVVPVASKRRFEAGTRCTVKLKIQGVSIECPHGSGVGEHAFPKRHSFSSGGSLHDRRLEMLDSG